MGAFELISLGLALLPKLIEAGQDVAELIGTMKDVADNKSDPTPEQWAAVHAIEDRLRARLHSDDV